MAAEPRARLFFDPEGCPDCGVRRASLPPPLPHPGDDIDLTARDYDDLRRVMLEDLAARQPERTRWSPADVDVMLVEALAASLDELSDMLDRVATESTLATARRPSSIRWLLEFIGEDPVRDALARGVLDVTEDEVDRLGRDGRDMAAEALDAYWFREPAAMELARAAGPRNLHAQHRMVTTADHANRLEDHPLVVLAAAWQWWSGTWPQIHVAVVAVDGHRLDDDVTGAFAAREIEATLAFHRRLRLPLPLPWTRPTPEDAPGVTLRSILQPFVDALRMAGSEVVLHDADFVPVRVSLSVRVEDHYFRSHVRRSLESVLGGGPGGLLAPGVRGFGRDLPASDVVEAAFSVEGVSDVCVNRLKRRGADHPDATSEGVIVLDRHEIAWLGPDDSGLDLAMHGGLAG